MPILYDGTHIFRNNNINYDSYRNYVDEQNKLDSKDLADINLQASERSLHKWLELCPPVFRKASIKSIEKYDSNVSTALNKAVEISTENNSPCSLIVGSKAYTNENEQVVIPKGKTWAIYAYIAELCKNRIINFPDKEIKFITEFDLIDNLASWDNSEQWLSNVFSESVKLIVIDDINCGSGILKHKFLEGAWSRFAQEAVKYNKNVGFVLSFSGDFVDYNFKQIKDICSKFIVAKSTVKVLYTKGIEA